MNLTCPRSAERSVAAYQPYSARIGLLLLGVAFNSLLIWYYQLSIVERHGYEGLVTRSVSTQYWVVAWIMSLLPLTWLPLRFEMPSDCCVWCLFLSAIAAAPWVALMVSRVHPTTILAYQATCMFCFLLLEVRRIPLIDAVSIPPALTVAVSHGCPIVLIALAVSLLAASGFRLNISFIDVYSRRTLASEMIAQGTLQSYLLALMTKALIPMAIIVGICRGRFVHLGLGILASLIVFSLDGSKITMIMPVMLAIIACLSARPKMTHSYYLVTGAILLIVTAACEESFFDTFVLNDFAVRRTFVTPSHLSTYYCEYFSTHPHVYMLDGLVGTILGTRYPVSPASMIGFEYFGSEEIVANTGIWASAFAHFGYTAMPCVSLMAALVLSILDSLTIGRSFVAGCCIAFVIGLSWAEKALPTSLLSGGVVGLMCMYYAMPNVDGSHFSARSRR